MKNIIVIFFVLISLALYGQADSYSTQKTYIDNNINSNGTGQITGSKLNVALSTYLLSNQANAEYDITRPYKLGQFCIENSIVFQANTDMVAGAFIAANWDTLCNYTLLKQIESTQNNSVSRIAEISDSLDLYILINDTNTYVGTTHYIDSLIASLGGTQNLNSVLTVGNTSGGLNAEFDQNSQLSATDVGGGLAFIKSDLIRIEDGSGSNSVELTQNRIINIGSGGTLYTIGDNLGDLDIQSSGDVKITPLGGSSYDFNQTKLTMTDLNAPQNSIVEVDIDGQRVRFSDNSSLLYSDLTVTPATANRTITFRDKSGNVLLDTDTNDVLASTHYVDSTVAAGGGGVAYGTSTEIPYMNATDNGFIYGEITYTAASDQLKIDNGASNNIRIAPTQINQQANNGGAIENILTNYDNAGVSSNKITFQRGRTATGILNGDDIASIRFDGLHEFSSFVRGAEVLVEATEDFTSGIGYGTKYSIFTASNGEITTSERLSIDTGAVQFNDAYTFPKIDGSANEVLTTNGSGLLGFSAPTNLFNSDGSLTGNRTVTMGGAYLLFSGNQTIFKGINDLSGQTALLVEDSSGADLLDIRNNGDVKLTKLMGINDEITVNADDTLTTNYLRINNTTAGQVLITNSEKIITSIDTTNVINSNEKITSQKDIEAKLNMICDTLFTNNTIEVTTNANITGNVNADSTITGDLKITSLSSGKALITTTNSVVSAVDTVNINNIQTLPTIITNAGDTTGNIPAKAGNIFIDTSNDKVYISKGNSQGDWLILN